MVAPLVDDVRFYVPAYFGPAAGWPSTSAEGRPAVLQGVGAVKVPDPALTAG